MKISQNKRFWMTRDTISFILYCNIDNTKRFRIVVSKTGVCRALQRNKELKGSVHRNVEVGCKLHGSENSSSRNLTGQKRSKVREAVIHQRPENVSKNVKAGAIFMRRLRTICLDIEDK